jgi:transcriptional regulator with XRE-family HTH domain
MQHELQQEIGLENLNLDLENGLNASSTNVVRAKTSIRMHYEAQARVIRSQIGDLEEVRQKLNLSARKMCQLLMIDPSAWSRWTKKGDEVPPHVWRALQWYLIVCDKIPGLTPQYFIGPFFSREIKSVEASLSSVDVERLNLVKLDLEKANTEIVLAQKQIIELQGAVKANRAAAILMGISAVILCGALFVIFSKMR